jgi:hypothetical protein
VLEEGCVEDLLAHGVVMVVVVVVFWWRADVGIVGDYY